MKTILKSITLTLATLFIIGTTADAKDKFLPVDVSPSDVPLFRANELQADIYFSEIFSDHDRLHTSPGGGYGFNYIFGTHFGLGVHNSWYSNDGHAAGLLHGSVILRAPIESLRLAPYITVGGGTIFTGSKKLGVGTVGLGLEHRITPNIGLFISGQYLYGSHSSGTGNAGLRFSF